MIKLFGLQRGLLKYLNTMQASNFLSKILSHTGLFVSQTDAVMAS